MCLYSLSHRVLTSSLQTCRKVLLSTSSQLESRVSKVILLASHHTSNTTELPTSLQMQCLLIGLLPSWPPGLGKGDEQVDTHWSGSGSDRQGSKHPSLATNFFQGPNSGTERQQLPLCSSPYCRLSLLFRMQNSTQEPPMPKLKSHALLRAPQTFL